MKKQIKFLLTTLVMVFTLMLTIDVFADAPPPPPPGGGHGQGGNHGPGGGAPVGEGIVLLTALGSLYGLKKWLSDREK